MPRVFVSAFIPEEILAPIRPLADVDMWEEEGPVTRAALVDRLPGCRGWISMLTDTIDEEILDVAPGLTVISQMSVGVDNIDVAACRARRIALGHTPDVLTETVADTAFALIAAAARRIPEGEQMVKAGAWGPWNPWQFLGWDLHMATLGIVGMGRIGQAINRRASGFEMQVMYTSRTTKNLAGATQVDLGELLREAGIVVLAAPLSPETHRMIGSREFRLMRDDAILVNIARGPLVATEALVEALAAGWIAGAALDVTDPEPLPPDHPLLGLPNCLVVPHIGSASVRARRAMAQLAVDNLAAALQGSPMPAPLPERS